MDKLIIISGGEAAGKSTIRDELAKRLNIEYLSKDTIKEKMFDDGSVSTWNFSYYEKRALDKLFRQIQEFLTDSQPLIIEANFKPTAQKSLRSLLNKEIEVYEIFCFTKGFTSFRRFVKRNESGNRHPGHHDRRWYPTVFVYCLCHILKVKWPYKPMGLSNKLLYLNTTDLANIDYQAIIKFITQPV